MYKKFSEFTRHFSQYVLWNSFPRKLMCAFLGATILPLIIISVFIYQTNARTSYERVVSSTALTNKQLVLQIESRFTQMEQVADTIRSYMYNYPTRSGAVTTEQLNTFYTIRTNIQTLVSAFNFKHICIFLDTDLVFNNEGLMFYGLDRLNDFQLSEEALKETDTDSTWAFIPGQSYPFMLSLKYETIDAINCVHMLRNSTADSLKYVFFISIDASEFTELLTASYDTTEVTGYLLDDHQQIVTASGTEEMQESIRQLTAEEPELLSSSTTFARPEALYYTNCLSNGWTYVTRVSQSFIRSNSASYIRTFLIVLIFLVPFSAAAVILLTKNFTRRITLLSKSAEQVNFNQNQFHGCTISYVETKPEKYYDEVDKLAITYNRMMETIQQNIDSITALRAQEESLKYQLLQSLINPHFLYNILDSIIACNSIGKPELANKLIMNLTKFYRMTLRKSNELITIRDELEIALLYMEMESICRGGNFTWEIALDDEIENFMICKFTLQPFIENSILHGMQGNSRKLHIHIEIRYGDDTILIFIRDNGHGIPPEKLGELQKSLNSRLVDTSKHFGISNVNARISSELFGHGFIEISSVLGQGTTVKIEFQQILP